MRQKRYDVLSVVKVLNRYDVLAVRSLRCLVGSQLAFQLPYTDGSFERVVSSLMFHHLTAEDKQRALGESFRVLKPGGELLIVDFAKPMNVIAWMVSLLMRRMEKSDDLIRGTLIEMIQRAGFQSAQINEHFMTIFGTLALYCGRKTH